MKQKIYLLLCMLCPFIMQNADGMCSERCNISTHTTLIPRQLSQNSVLELGLFNYFDHHRDLECNACESWVNVEVVAPYYFKSTRSSKLAQYFIPRCQDCVSVGQNNTSDISSPWLNVSGTGSFPYQSTICIAPTRSVVGGALRLYFDLSGFLDNCGCFGSHWWASIFIPVQQVRHNLHVSETLAFGSGVGLLASGFAFASQALNNPAWTFGKWSPNTLTKVGVDDIAVKLGYDFADGDCGDASLYALLFIPTGRGTKAKYMFEPLVGGNHVGLGLGFNGDYRAYECDQTSVDLMCDVRYAYFFKHTERRSIDLFNGDLSRYLLVVQQATLAAPDAQVTPLPGINAFTQDVKITPRGMFEVWAAIGFNSCNWHLELGYDFWLRSKEKISLPDKTLDVGIFDIAAALNPAAGICAITAHCARICQALPGADAPVSDATFTFVQNSNAINEQGTTQDGNSCCPVFCAAPNQCSFLNLDSAASPRALSSTIYGAISRECCWCDHAIMVGVGAQYEFANRSALSQYGLWLKTAISF